MGPFGLLDFKPALADWQVNKWLTGGVGGLALAHPNSFPAASPAIPKVPNRSYV